MKTERELFEDWCHINDEFCTHRYTDNCQEYSDDYTQSAWLAWQASVPEGYVVVPKHWIESAVDWGALDSNISYGDESKLNEMRAMLEAVEK